MQTLLARVMPFLILGIMIVILVVGIVVLSYLLVFGAVIGLFLFGIAWFKEKLFPSKLPTRRPKQGQTFDHDDFV
jgi:hypothetical protein